MKHWIQDLIGAGLAITVGLSAVAMRPFAAWFEGWSYDLPFLLRPEQQPGGVVLVSMDAASRTTLAQEDASRWDRQLHANLLDRLVARGARVVVFTTVFSESSPTNAADRAFAQALRRARGRVMLAATATETTLGTVQKPAPDLAAAALWGTLASPRERDGVVRRHDLPTVAPTLAARVAQLLGRPPTNAPASRWFNYYAPRLQLPELSYEQALNGTEPPGALRGKIVIVGPARPDSELLPTPYTHWSGPRATRAEIEATAILNLSRREWLSRQSTLIESGVLVAAGGLFGLVFMGRRRRAAVLLALGAILVVTAANYVLVARFQLWFPWLVVVALQIPVALGWAWLCEFMDRPRSPRYSATLTEASSAPAAPAPATPPSLAHPSAGRPGAQSIGTSDSPVIPDHNLIKCIGRGAYGEVWLARDVIGRHDAVKIVKARNFPHAAPYEREFKGIERYASISRNHPGLVQALHIGRRDAQGCFFYIMELADDASGATSVDPSRYLPKTLASELARRGHLPVQESVQIGLAMCGALGHLHERRLAHRDVKSSNIIFVEGAPKIADVGLVTPLAAGTGDLDHDGHTDSEEFRTGTNPANDASILRVLTLTSLGNGGKTILWSAAPGRTYRVQFKAGITDAEWSELPHLVTAAGTTASAADASSAGDSHRFYRVRLAP